MNETYSIEEVFALLKEHASDTKSENGAVLHRNPKRMEYQGHTMRVHSLKYLLFMKKGTTCVSCGCKGQYFRLTQAAPSHPPVFNLYALKDDREVLMNVDHIIPKAHGGADCLANAQTMCVECNMKKAHTMPATGEGKVGNTQKQRAKAKKAEPQKHTIKVSMPGPGQLKNSPHWKNIFNFVRRLEFFSNLMENANAIDDNKALLAKAQVQVEELDVIMQEISKQVVIAKKTLRKAKTQAWFRPILRKIVPSYFIASTSQGEFQ